MDMMLSYFPVLKGLSISFGLYQVKQILIQLCCFIEALCNKIYRSLQGVNKNQQEIKKG
jgi:hypothetical protein